MRPTIGGGAFCHPSAERRAIDLIAEPPVAIVRGECLPLRPSPEVSASLFCGELRNAH
jgi:hypothetical protein